MISIRQNPFLNLPKDNYSDDDYNNYNYNSDDSLLDNDMIIQNKNSNNSNNIPLLKKSKKNNINNNINRKNKFENKEINTNNINSNDNSINIITIDNYIIWCMFIIVSILCYGLYNLVIADNIIYNNYGKIILYNYYIINLLWFSIFIIINIFLKIGKYYNIINDINYVNYVLFNYNHIKYNIIIKILFMITLLTIIIMDISIQIQLSPNNTLPNYYNIIIVEIILTNIFFGLAMRVKLNI